MKRFLANGALLYNTSKNGRGCSLAQATSCKPFYWAKSLDSPQFTATLTFRLGHC